MKAVILYVAYFHEDVLFGKDWLTIVLFLVTILFIMITLKHYDTEKEWSHYDHNHVIMKKTIVKKFKHCKRNFLFFKIWSAILFIIDSYNNVKHCSSRCLHYTMCELCTCTLWPLIPKQHCRTNSIICLI